MKEAILARYGFGYVPAPQVRLPEPTPLYVKDNSNAVLEHGQWCLDRCLGEKGAREHGPNPASIPVYVANEQRILQIMDSVR